MKDVIFISWEKHQRTRSFCEKLSIPLLEIISAQRGLRRYFENIQKTVGIIKSHKPKVLLVQNPSIVLAAFAVVLKMLLGFRLIVDAHNEAIVPFIHDKWLVRLIGRWIIRQSNATLVTNQMLANKVLATGGNPIVLPDLLPEKPVEDFLAKPSSEKTFEITLISTYANDEPYWEVFHAVNALGDKFQLSVTGKIPAHLDTAKIPSNVHLLGFLSHEDYWQLLYKSHLIIDLSTMENCLVCGAYESLAIQKPILLSANPASLELFGEYAEHVANTSDSIELGIKNIVNHYNELAGKIAGAKLSFLRREQRAIEQIRSYIEN